MKFYAFMELKLTGLPKKLQIGRYGDIRIEIMNRDLWEIIDDEPVLV